MIKFYFSIFIFFLFGCTSVPPMPENLYPVIADKQSKINICLKNDLLPIDVALGGLAEVNYSLTYWESFDKKLYGNYLNKKLKTLNKDYSESDSKFIKKYNYSKKGYCDNLKVMILNEIATNQVTRERIAEQERKDNELAEAILMGMPKVTTCNTIGTHTICN